MAFHYMYMEENVQCQQLRLNAQEELMKIEVFHIL